MAMVMIMAGRCRNFSLAIEAKTSPEVSKEPPSVVESEGGFFWRGERSVA